MLKTGTRFSLRDKRLFEITEVEITRVDCIIGSPYIGSKDAKYEVDVNKPCSFRGDVV